MKTVFIFGAGASELAGGPLMSGFLDRAHDLLRIQTPGVIEAEDAFDDVFDAIAELKGIHSKSYLDLNNIEIVFGAIEMGLLLGRLGKRTGDSLDKLRNSLITLIYKTLEYSIPFNIHERGFLPPQPYEHFMRILGAVERDQCVQDPHKFTFLTFNYDLCLDMALRWARKSFDYCLDKNNNKDASCLLLKLHGSINWGLSHDGQIIPYSVYDVRAEDYFDSHPAYIDLGSRLIEKTHDGQTLKGPPVIVPPTWNKNSYHGQLTNVWSWAAYEFAQAENIFIIGYSLPETDSFFRYLYALGSNSDVRLRNFVIINPEPKGGGVESRFRQLIGKGIEDRFLYIPNTFDRSMNDIERILIKFSRIRT